MTGMFPAQAVPIVDPARQCPPIPRPGTPSWLLALAMIGRPTRMASRRRPAVTVTTSALIAVAAIVPAFTGYPGGLVSTIGLTTGALLLGVVGRLGRRHLVADYGDKIDGVAITGEAWALLRDTALRFDDARRMIDQVPTGLDWEEIWPDVNALLWDAAERAAKVAALDAELDEVKWAEPGTPQGAYRDALLRRRDDEYQIMRAAQWEAYTLQREAGNAAAAAKIALMHVGSVAALERVVPSTVSLRARIHLAEARAKLALLTEAWAELDPQHAVLEARIDAASGALNQGRPPGPADGPAELPPGSPRATP